MYSPLTDLQLTSLLGFLAEEEDPFVFLESARLNAENHRSLLFRQPVAMLRLTCGQAVSSFFEEVERYLEQGYHLAGWFSYELGYLLEPALAGRLERDPALVLAELGVFRAPHVYDHRHACFSGVGGWPEGPLPADGEAYSVANLHPSVTREEYLVQIERIKSYIAAGDTYQVNYTLKLLFDFAGSAAGLYRALRRNQQVSYGAYLKMGSRLLLSFSPELFFRKQGRRCTVRPMKGTMPRGRTGDEDQALREFLGADLKNRSENVMIVDLLRNDLGRLSRPGGVCVRSLFDVEVYESLFQMTSTIEGELQPGVSVKELFKALFPCGSVTGAPKIRTMEIIQELEAGARGPYTGAIGYFAPDGEAVFSVPIRTVLLENGRGEMGIGSGIVYDSDPAREWEECLVKASFLSAPRPSFRLLETMVWLPDQGFWLLDLHLERLRSSAGYFGFRLNSEGLCRALEERAAGFDRSAQRVRLLLDKAGSFLIEAVACEPPQPLLPQPNTAAGELPRIGLAAETTCSASPFLYHKTTCRELYDQARRKALAAGFYEVLFRNERGEITEGSISNLFVRRGDRFLTPPVSCGLLNGVCRQQLMRVAKVEEQVLRAEDLREAEALFVGNSVRGMVQVRF